MSDTIYILLILSFVSGSIIGYILGNLRFSSDLLIDYIKSNDYDKLLEENKQLKRIIKIKKEDF